MEGQTYPGSGGEEVSRAPRISDVTEICRELNRLSARYVVVGGFAIIQAGFHRFTGDIDFLIDPSLENEARVFQALRILPDQAVAELSSGDVSKYLVVRVADEVVVDLMANACGVDYATAIQDAKFSEIDGVNIPFASPKMLLRMKQTVRDKDAADRAFLTQVIERATDKKEKSSFLGEVLEEIKKQTKT